MEFHMRILEDKNQIQKSMYIPQYLSSGLYGSAVYNNNMFLLGVVNDICLLLMSPYTSYDSADSQDIFPIRNMYARQPL